MAAPFYERLHRYYQQAGAVLRGETASASIFPNPTDRGLLREDAYGEFLRAHVPSECNLINGGFLFGQDGTESRQIGCWLTWRSERHAHQTPQGTC
ncbi:MAG: hypothetical protein ACKVZ0_12540 [Gemmatimonadales bacterium]